MCLRATLPLVFGLTSLLTLTGPPVHAQGRPPPGDRLASPAGEVRVTERAITVGNRIVLPADGGMWAPAPTIAASAPAGSPAIILIRFDGGSACEATYRVLDLRAAPPVVTAEFGTCSDLATLVWDGTAATVAMPGRRGAVRWRYTPAAGGRPGNLIEERRR